MFAHLSTIVSVCLGLYLKFSLLVVCFGLANKEPISCYLPSSAASEPSSLAQYRWAAGTEVSAWTLKIKTHIYFFPAFLLPLPIYVFLLMSGHGGKFCHNIYRIGPHVQKIVPLMTDILEVVTEMCEANHCDALTIVSAYRAGQILFKIFSRIVFFVLAAEPALN